MKIRQIDLENIGCFVNRSFDFKSESSGISVVYGENRTGKSTLVHAIFFALFGKHLNRGLSARDLCRKGETAGRAVLAFAENGQESATDYRITQSTRHLPVAERKSDKTGQWETVFANAPDTLQQLIPLPPEIAALTSFFREGELIYFLQDVPKYNNTLLQNLIGMDDAIILKNRFKKALAKAREYRKAVKDAAPPKAPDALDLEYARRALETAEKSFEQADREYQQLGSREDRNLTVYKLIRQQYADKTGQKEKLLSLKENRPAYGDLKRKRDAFAAQEVQTLSAKISPEKLSEQLGMCRKIIDENCPRLKKLDDAAHDIRTPTCHVCGQSVDAEQLAKIREKLAGRIAAAEKEHDEIETALKNLHQADAEARSRKLEMARIDAQIDDIKKMDTQIDELTDQIDHLASDIKAFGFQGEDIRAAESASLKKDDAAKRRKNLQNEIVRQKVAIAQHGDMTRRVAESQKNIAEAERRVQICSVAHQALEAAIHSLGGQLLAGIRESICRWTGHFSFLNHFEIEIGDSELLPIIQAKGYQYKLNQMSKSERIFLYLMLKLAIGDALGHLGCFILDDPADGLDNRRKETLAYLLAEISKQRQVIVTTNDALFADMFPGSARVDL